MQYSSSEYAQTSLRFLTSSSICFIIYLLIDLIYSQKEKVQLVVENSSLRYNNLENEYRILKAQINPHFLFNALNAFQVNGIGYILKPFTIEAIELGIKKFETLTQQKDNQLAALLQYMEHSIKPKVNASILVHQGDKIIPVNLDNEAVVSLKNGIVKLHTFDKNEFVASETLEELVTLNSPKFFRANRQFLVHQKAIRNATRYFNRRLSLHLYIPFDEKIIISKEKAPVFLEWLAHRF